MNHFVSLEETIFNGNAWTSEMPSSTYLFERRDKLDDFVAEQKIASETSKWIIKAKEPP